MSEATAEETRRAAVPDGPRVRIENGTADSPTRVGRMRWFVVSKSLKARFAGRFLPPGSSAFRTLMLGSSISMFGSRISTVAFPMLVLGLYNSPFVTGLVAFAAITPSLLFYIPAGVIVDRCNPRLVMIYSELLRGGAIASVVVALLLFRHHINVWFLIFAMIVEEILEILSVLADRRYLSRLMERENRDSMASQQAFIEVRTHTAVLAGRPIGPFLFDLQPIFPFLADALSFIVSFISLLVISRTDEPVRDAPAPPQPRRQLIREIFQGISWLRSDRRAWVTITLMAMTSLVAQALILMLLAQAHSKHLSTVAIGVVLAASGAGGAVGSLCFRFLPGGLKGFWLPIQMLLWSLTLAFLWLAGGLPAAWSALAMFVLGLTGAIGNIEFGTYLVAHVADYMIARVAAVGQMLAIGACALGPVLGGYAIQRFGVEGAVVILLLIVAMLSLLCLLMPGAFQKIASVFRSLRRIFAPVQLWTNLLRTFASAPRRRRDGDPAEFPGGMPHSSSGHSSQTQGQVSCEKLVSPSSPKSVDYSQPSTSNGLICGNADVQFSSGTEKHSFDRLGASADGASTRQLDPVLPAGQLVDIDSTPFPL